MTTPKVKKSVRWSDVPDTHYIVRGKENASVVKDTFDSILYTSLQTNLLNALNNFSQDDVYVYQTRHIGMETIIDISPLHKGAIIDKIRTILYDPRYRNEYIKLYKDRPAVFEKFVETLYNPLYRNEPTLRYIVDAFSGLKQPGQRSIHVVMLLKLIYPTLDYMCKSLEENEAEVMMYLKRMVVNEVAHPDRFVYYFAKHVQLTFGCSFGKNLTFPSVNGGGTEYKTYNRRRYKIHTGTRGGRYILVQKEKKYI